MTIDAQKIFEIKKSIIAIGRLLWEKELVTGLNGNISCRVEGETIAITATQTCLGLLAEKNILTMTVDGEVLEEGRVSSEKLVHTEIYKAFPQVAAVIHTHVPYTNAYFLENDALEPRIFESKVYLGRIDAVPQETPAVTDAGPVIAALKKSNIAALKNHGVVAVGKDLFECFLLIQCLEDAAKIEAISKIFKDHGPSTIDYRPETGDQRLKANDSGLQSSVSSPQKYKLFSKDQIGEIVKLVNGDAKMKELGTKTGMNMDLGVQLNETGQVFSFKFEQGRITDVCNDNGVEFLISADEAIWRAVFNREIDPFVATTQKKMNLRGDFARISKWYAPCSRIFELWAQVPVE